MACDLWSLGVVAYMLLSGAPPFHGGNDEDVRAVIVRGAYAFPHELFLDVSDDAMAFVTCLLFVQRRNSGTRPCRPWRTRGSGRTATRSGSGTARMVPRGRRGAARSVTGGGRCRR